jgi:hypothetical protein
MLRSKLLLILALLMASPAAASEQAVRDYIDWFMRDTRPSRATRAKRYVPDVMRMARKYRIHPLRIAIVISAESSWLPHVEGKRGEKGLGQTHGAASRGLPVGTTTGQIEATARWLRMGLDECGNWIEANSWYMTGYCRPAVWAARRRNKAYNDAMKMFERGD